MGKVCRSPIEAACVCNRKTIRCLSEIQELATLTEAPQEGNWEAHPQSGSQYLH